MRIKGIRPETCSVDSAATSIKSPMRGESTGMKLDSPLRYPGGKASLAVFLARTIESNDLSGCAYFEPFAGGAGAALRLLQEGIVSELHLNDLDPRITAFWVTVLNESEQFAEDIQSVAINITEWRKQRDIYLHPDTSKTFELGFATFYLNRCNRSGILLGAAPIGGYAQTGKWKIDARFNRQNLANRILAIASKRESIHITKMDARAFLVKHLPRGRERQRVFTYLDPPYYSNGGRLYMNSYTDRHHKSLAGYIQQQRILKWVMSYDDTPFIRNMYKKCVISHLSLQYSLQRKQQAQELLIAPPHVQLPPSVAPIDMHECKEVLT